jgi:hypothetical protein
VLGHEQGVGAELERALHRRVVGGHVRLADAPGQHDQVSLLEVRDRAQADERLSHRRDGQRGHDPDLLGAARLESAAQQEAVHDRAEHADVVRLRAIDPPPLGQ